MQILQIEEIFTKAEFILMCAILNGVNCSPSTFLANISAGFDYENTSEICEGTLLKKISQLSMLEIAEIMCIIYEFWDKDGEFDIDEALEDLDLNFQN